LKKSIKNLKNAIFNISAILKKIIIKQVKMEQAYKVVLPKHVLFFKSVEKYKSENCSGQRHFELFSHFEV
jgi:hypothetical protein